jgi:hypothetical protein
MNKALLVRLIAALCVTALLFALAAFAVEGELVFLDWAKTAPQGKWIAVDIAVGQVALTWLVLRRRRASRMISREVARGIIEQRLKHLRQVPYAELVKRRGEAHFECIPGAPGREYRVETRVIWDRPKKKNNLRVLVSVAGGGVSVFSRPMLDDFILAPDGSFVGERAR